MYHKEVRPLNDGVAPPISVSRSQCRVRPADIGIALAMTGSPLRSRILDKSSPSYVDFFSESRAQDPVERKAHSERSNATIRDRCEGFRPIGRRFGHAAVFFDSISSTILPIESR